jgi:hypothetical protein
MSQIDYAQLPTPPKAVADFCLIPVCLFAFSLLSLYNSQFPVLSLDSGLWNLGIMGLVGVWMYLCSGWMDGWVEG